MDSIKFIIVGTGYMAKEYAKSLKSLNIDFSVIGNTHEKCNIFKKDFKVKVYSGGLEKNINKINDFTHIIIATPVELLNDHLELVINLSEIKNILIEKPGGLDKNRLMSVAINIMGTNRNVYIAYNRRFYESAIKAKEIIYKDGGPTSFHFNVSELIHTIDMDKFNENVLKNWFVANTSHLVDLAFYLCGWPQKINCNVYEGVNWNKNSIGIYIGTGETEINVPFTYHGDWTSAGRWSLEIYTRDHSLLFCPLELLQIRNKGEVQYNNIELDKDSCKEGITNMIQAFINRSDDLPSLIEQEFAIDILEKMNTNNSYNMEIKYSKLKLLK